MSSGKSQNDLTFEDLDNFLAKSSGQAAPEAAAAGRAAEEFAPYFDAASVLAAFDPFKWQPDINKMKSADGLPYAESPVDEELRGRLLDPLLLRCEQIFDGPQRGRWRLTGAERRRGLKNLATRQRMRDALQATARRPKTPTQRMFEEVVGGEALDLAALSRDELAALITVLDWTEGILDDLPQRNSVLAQLARADLLAPMQRLLRDGFVNRESELERLARYAHSSAKTPLFVFGSGGVGKSTLLAKFILDMYSEEVVPFAYIDMDRPTLRALDPLTILLEIIAQLRQQLEFNAENLDALVNEIVRDIESGESGRYQETLVTRKGTIYFKERFMKELLPALDWGNDEYVLIFVDTFEEAQWLGLEIVRTLLDFLFELQNPDIVKIIIAGRDLAPEYVRRAFSDREMADDGDRELQDFLEGLPQDIRPINVDVLDIEPAHGLLSWAIEQVGLSALEKKELDEIIGIVGCNPMCLKLAVRILQEQGLQKLRESRSEFLSQLKAEKIQALLYGRILHHIHNEDVRKVAYPGLVVRRITPDVIREVLAGPCELELGAKRDEYDIFADMAKEVALVRLDTRDGSLRHRVDVRRAMLLDLTDHVDEEVVEGIDRAAVAFYGRKRKPEFRAEEIYHRLRLGEEEDTLNDRWGPDLKPFLKDALPDLPARQALWLANRLDISLDESIRHQAGQEDWEDQVARSVDRYLQSGEVDMALKLLYERQDRLPRSQLYGLEAEALHIVGAYEEALRVGRAGVDALSAAAAIDMTLDLLLKMAVIEETQGHLADASRLLEEARAVAVHSSSDLAKLRVQITTARILRKLTPYAVDEQADLREAILANLTQELLDRLGSHPVLLRETAAEVGAYSPGLTQKAITTLGIEIATDEQAEAFVRVLTEARTAPDGYDFSRIVDLIEQMRRANYDPGVARILMESLSTSDIDTIAEFAGKNPADSEFLRAFQTYFRAGKESMLNELGEVYQAMDRPEDALRHYEQALPVMREVGDREGEARTLANLASVLWTLGQVEEALQLNEEALLIWQELDDHRGVAETLSSIGSNFDLLDRPQEALRSYEAALAAWRSVPDRGREARTLVQIGSAHAALDRNREALPPYNEALAIYRDLEDAAGEAHALDMMGSTYRALERPSDALNSYNSALALWREQGDADGEARTLDKIGMVYETMERPEEALRAYKDALSIYRATGDRMGEALTLDNAGWLYRKESQPELALEIYKEALPLWRELGDRSNEALVLLHMGDTALAAGEPGEALDRYDQALPIWREVEDRQWEAATLEGMGRAYAAAGKRDKARSFLLEAQAVFSELGDEAAVEGIDELLKNL